jgi:hypothetical protein
MRMRFLLVVLIAMATSVQSHAQERSQQEDASASARYELPEHCANDQVRDHIFQQVPRLLGVDPSAATISSVGLALDLGRHLYHPAWQGSKARYILKCAIQVRWSNGHMDGGYYEEWEDPYGQIKTYFGPDEYNPPAMP